MSSAPRIVLLSNHHANSLHLSRGLIEAGIKLDTVLMICGSPKPLSQGVLVWARSLASMAKRRLRFYWREKAFYKNLTPRTLPTGDMNSAAMVRHLKRLKPDYIVVGGGGILKPMVIETAQCGVLNGHPGLLPWVRGCGVVGHAVEQGVPVGATVHYIDAGIDTGPIIERRLLPVTSGVTLGDLERAAADLTTQLVGDVVREIQRTGQKPAANAHNIRFPLYRWTDLAKRKEQNELVKSGRALDLFEKWKGLTDGEPNWRLPLSVLDKP